MVPVILFSTLHYKGLCVYVAVTILLAMSVYQIIVSEKLPSSFNSIPVIGQ